LNVWQHVPTIDDAYTSWSSSSSLDLATCLKSSRSLIILRRLTVELADHAQNYSLNNLSSLLNAYDLIAIRPTSEKVFHAVCSGTYPSIDLISLDLGSRLPFYLKMKTVLMAVEKGFSFEICYGHAIT
ncbi:RNA-binding RNA processing protein rpp1, partial [Spiromyces aspiralis]